MVISGVGAKGGGGGGGGGEEGSSPSPNICFGTISRVKGCKQGIIACHILYLPNTGKGRQVTF